MEWSLLLTSPNASRRTRRLLATTLLAVTLTGCATATPQNNYDPYEAVNRKVYAFNDVADRAGMKPIAEGYRFILPQPIRTGVSNFFNNLQDALSVVHHVLQAKPERAVSDLMRVALNSTFGLGGLLDIATPARLPSYKTGLGETLARWGYQNSSYVELPLYGPSTVRDAVGLGGDMLTGPSHFLWKTPSDSNSLLGLNIVNQRAGLLDVTAAADEAALDPYTYRRDGYLQYRNQRIGNAAALKPVDDSNINDLVAPTTPASAAPAEAVVPATPAPAAQ